MNNEIKKQIRDLNKCKRQTRVGTEDRRIIVRQIRDLKSKLQPKETDNEKLLLIKKIIEFDSWWATHKDILLGHSKEELQMHINKRGIK